MKIAIISNFDGIGLEVDFQLLRDFLQEKGHEVTGVQFDKSAPQGTFDLMIALEVTPKHLLQLAPERWLFVNCEWLTDAQIPIVRQHFSKVLCKTHDAHRICSELFGDKAIYTGFMTRDRMDESIPRERKFLHVGGNSGFRNTQAIIDAWALMSDPPELTIVSRKHKGQVPGITFYERVTDDELKFLQNSHLYHLYPSGYEGWGHALHEGLSVGATVLTLAAAPMDEFGCYLMAAKDPEPYNQATVWSVDPRQISLHVEALLNMGPDPESRDEFEEQNADFATAFEEVLNEMGSVLPCVDTPVERGCLSSDSSLAIAILGNFGPSHSTENDWAWSFEHIGHRVIRMQENTPIDHLGECLRHNADLFLYIHTHGWPTISEEAINGLRGAGIKTASVHLDKFAGIPEREEEIGRIPFWKTDFVFTADGGNERLFNSRGVKHIWLPPGIVEHACHYGVPRSEYRCDVAFVGARSYHSEYPFREKLIGWLERTYGSRFRLFQGVRGRELNDLYASVKCCVGDNIFAGSSDFYFSDRAVECPGRGGFLIYPDVVGLDVPCAKFTPGNLSGLKEQIDYYLSHEGERRSSRITTHEYVRMNCTYTKRAQRILDVVFKAEVRSPDSYREVATK